MREVLDELGEVVERGEAAALVTLVGERGSTPRSAGARMLVRADGSTTGTIGGGALEAEVTRAATRVIERRSSRLVATRLAGDSIAGGEMLCGGAVEALIAYVAAGDPIVGAICEAVGAALEGGARVWVATVFDVAAGKTVGVGADQEVDGAVGASAAEVSFCLVDEHGETVGSLPCPPGELTRAAGRAELHGSAQLPDGRRVHVEMVGTPSAAFICGAGHVARALAPVAASVGFEVTVLDDRDAFANAERFPDADRVVVLESFDDAFAGLRVDEQSYVAIVTRGHEHDFRVLTQALRTPATYIGLMSSRTKRRRIEEGLREAGFGDDDVARLHVPIGVAIGAESPPELAVSIVAEMIAVRAGLD